MPCRSSNNSASARGSGRPGNSLSVSDQRPCVAGIPAECRCILAEEHGDAVEAGSDPHDLAGGAELIELSGVEAENATWQDVGLPQGHRQRQSLKGHERLAQRRPAVDPVPVRQEAAERRLLGRLDFLPQRRERCAAQTPEDVRVTPLPLGPAGTQLAAHQLLLPLELAQQRLDVAAEPLVRLCGGERPASAGVTRDELLERLGPALEEDFRQTARRHHADGVAIAARILGGDQPLLACEAYEQRTTLAQERLREAFVVFAFAQVSAQAKLVVKLVGVAWVAAQLRLDLLDCIRIEQ